MPKANKPTHELVASDGTAYPIKPYARPGRTVATFKVKIKNKAVECVTTRGEAYTYFNLDGVDSYVDGRLKDGASYKVRECKVEEAEAAE